MKRRGRSGQAPIWVLATQPGAGRILADEVRRLGAADVTLESDGRSDLVLARSAEPPGVDQLPAEDLYLLLSTAPVRDTAKATAARLVDTSAWQVQLDRAKALGLPVGATTRYRLVVRVRSETRFKRTELRSALHTAIAAWRPRWRVEDPAPVEFWVLETAAGRFRAMIRLSSAVTRSRGGREVERHGALRPALASAMLALARMPSAGEPRLLDCFCGSGTILVEGARRGWRVTGSDVDPAAVEAARANVRDGDVRIADASALPFADEAFDAVVSNLPFGHQHDVVAPEGVGEREFWRRATSEIVRVARPGADVVLLHPRRGPAVLELEAHPALELGGRTSVRALGRPAVIHSFRVTKRPSRAA